MIANGLLKADKVGGRWLIQLSSVEKRQEARRLPGRMFSPGRAWGLLWLASRRHPDWLSPTDISHLRRRLRQASLIDLAPRLQKRAVVHRLRAHPSDLPRIAEEPQVIKTGVSIAHSLDTDLAHQQDFLDAYVQATQYPGLMKKYALQPGSRHNLLLRVIESSWPFSNSASSAPRVVVGLDLLEDDDERLQRAGRSLLLKRHD